MRRNIIQAVCVMGALLLLFAVCISACTGKRYRVDYRDEAEYVIGVSQANMREAWRLALIQEIEEEAAKYQNIRIITTDATADVEKQKQDVEKLLQFGIDLLIISPCDTSKLTEKVEEVYQGGTPVIVMDRGVEGFEYSLFIGPDNDMIGRQTGETVMELLNGKAGTVLKLCGNIHSIQSQERIQGFDSIVEKEPRITLRAQYMDTELKDTAYDVVTAMDGTLEEIDVIFASSDYVAQGAYEALEDMGMEKSIKIVGSEGFTGEGESVDMVLQGKIAATISCPTGGKEAIQYAMNILKQENGVPKQVILRSHIITKENASKYRAGQETEIVDNGQTITVGYSQVGQESQWRAANTYSIQEAAKEFNIQLLFDDANQSQERQIAAIRRFIQEQVDVIVVSPVIETGWDEVLKEARAAGIPVVMSDRKVTTKEKDLTTTYIGADFLEEGRRAMRWICDNIVPEGKTLNILELKGNKGASPTEERGKGFAEVLEECPGYRIVYSEYGNFTYEEGREIIDVYIQEHAWDIDIIYSHNDDMALGAIEALEAHGISPGTDVKIVSVDATKDAFRAMVEGKLNCAVECNPLLGAPLMKAIRDMVAGKEMPVRIITEEKVYDQSVAEELMNQRMY